MTILVTIEEPLKETLKLNLKKLIGGVSQATRIVDERGDMEKEVPPFRKIPNIDRIQKTYWCTICDGLIELNVVL